MAFVAGSRWSPTGGLALQALISFDAFLVLAGSVLTSFVGVVGLIRRLAMDGCLPSVLLAENKFRKTNHWIILLFFGICTSILVILKGEVAKLSDVYTIAFLCVMSLFAIGNMMLKYKRNHLKREVVASWSTCFAALFLTVAGLVGTIVREPQQLVASCQYCLILTGLLRILLCSLGYAHTFHV